MPRKRTDTEVIIERLDNVKEAIRTQFKGNSRQHEKIFDRLTKHGNSISYLKASIGIGGIVLSFLTGTVVHFILN